MNEGLLGKIPNKVDSNILAVYTDYENDANGAYTFMLGARVSSTDSVPTGMVAKKIPAADMLCLFQRRDSLGKWFLRLGAASGPCPKLNPVATGPTKPILKSMINERRTHRMPR